MLRQSCKRLLGVAVGQVKLTWKSAAPCRFLSQVNTTDLPTCKDLPATFSLGFDDNDPDVGTGYATCRHTIKLQIKVEPNTRKIVDVSYFPSSCPSVIACSSALARSELLKGKKLDEALQLNEPWTASSVVRVYTGTYLSRLQSKQPSGTMRGSMEENVFQPRTSPADVYGIGNPIKKELALL